MAALSDKDLAIMIGDNYAADAAALHQKFLKKLEPKPPSSLTRTGALLSMAIAVVSIVAAVYMSSTTTDKNAVIPVAAFSSIACGWVLWCGMKVLQGFNTGSNRINSVLAMITNSLIGSILVLFAGFGQPTQSIILSVFAIINLIAIFAWFWETTDCID
jgi:hypothetical protein